MGKAKITPTNIDLLKKLNSDRKKQAGRTRADFSGVSENSIGARSSSVGVSTSTGSPFNTGGGRISGYLSFFPKTLTVTANTIDLEDQTAGTGNVTGNTSNVNVTGGGIITQIDGANDEGQLLIIKAQGTTVTLRDGVGISTPGASDYVILDDEAAILIGDAVGSNTWVVIGVEGGAGGGGADNLGDHIATEALKMNDSAIYFDTAQIHAIISGTNVMSYVVGDATSGAHQFFVDDLGNPVMKITEDEVEINADILGVDRIQIVGGTTSSTSVNDVAFYLDSSGDLVSNVNANDGWIWSSGNTIKMTHTDSTLQKRNVTSPSFELYNTRSAAAGTAGSISFLAESASQSGVAMAYIIGETETATGFGSGSMKLGVNDSGSSTNYIELNDGNSGTIEMFKNLDMNDNNIIDVNILSFSSAISGQFFGTTVGGIQYHVPSSDSHDFYVADDRIIEIDESHLNMFGNELDFNTGGRVDFADTQQTIGSNGLASALTANPVGYVKVKVGGTERIMPYYRA